MRKGLHPAQQWISIVMPSGRLLRLLATKVTKTPKVYNMKARRQMAEAVGQIAKFKRRYGGGEDDEKSN